MGALIAVFALGLAIAGAAGALIRGVNQWAQGEARKPRDEQDEYFGWRPSPEWDEK
jgi:hypothetical protein